MNLCFFHRQKYRIGRVPKTQIWVFGIVDTSFKPALSYMQIVENRSTTTFLSIIDRICLPETIIHSDEWEVYMNIDNILGYKHLILNHSLNFVNPTNGPHTQHGESYWARQKFKIKK